MDFFTEVEGQTKIRRPAVLAVAQCNCGETFVEETEEAILAASSKHTETCKEWIPTTVLVGNYVHADTATL